MVNYPRWNTNVVIRGNFYSNLLKIVLDGCSGCIKPEKKHHLVILDYMVTSKYTHLLVYDNGSADVIPKSVQLLAGRIGQEYNIRKKVLSGRTVIMQQRLKYVTAVEGAILSSARILMAAVLGPWIAMDPPLEVAGWIGAMLIFLANVVLAFRKACKV
jgi:hypothetical protein